MTSTHPILTYPPIDRIRRNHGLEHATIHVLTARRKQNMAGYSDANGFTLVGELETDQVESAVAEALRRMRQGEADLAVHPNCGTNFVTAGMFGGLAAFVSFLGARTFRDKLERLPLAFVMVTAAIIFAQPVGLRVQTQITTSGRMGTMEVVAIKKVAVSPIVMHRIETRG